MRNATLSVILLAFTAGCSIESNISNRRNSDVWMQSPNDEVDILFVVDDSGSMAEEQQALADGFRSFVPEMEDANADFHLGLITTSADLDDPAAGVLIGNPPYLTPQDAYVERFKHRIHVGVHGSDQEKGLGAATLALSDELLDGPNHGFIRDGANLLVVVVSDEEDCSDDGALDGMLGRACYEHQDALPPTDVFVDRLVDLKGDPDLVQVGAIIGPNGNACADTYPGFRYARAAQLTNGRIGDICDSDWSGMLTELGLDAAGILTEFTLSRGAREETIIVKVDGFTVDPDPFHGWTYDAITWDLTFHGDAIPERGSEILATYEVLPGIRFEDDGTVAE